MKLLPILLILLLPFGSAYSQNDDCYPPKPNRLVVDVVGILNPGEVAALEQRLLELNNTTSNQAVIVTLNKLCEGDAAMTAYQIGKRWGVGQREFDNGIVILIKPTGGAGQRHTFIATGRGLEGAIPDATAKLIVDREMIPDFQNENYFTGLNKAIDVIEELATGEYSFSEYNKKQEPTPGLSALIPVLLVFGIWFLLFYRRTKNYADTNNLDFWAALALLNAANRSHRGHYGGFNRGSGGFGSGGFGGGFGGFGGGSFGGGGAGGSW